MLIIVEDDTSLPGLYGAMAAIVAKATGSRLLHLPATFDAGRFPDGVQHPTADGRLVACGMLWAERLGVGFSEIAALPAHDEQGDIVVLHPGTAAIGTALSYRVTGDGRDRWVVDAATGEEVTAIGRWCQDRFGRWCPTLSCQTATNGPVCRIALIGAEAEQRHAYPATLAALGDAADALERDLDVSCLDPLSIGPDSVRGDYHGFVLPGGADMARVAGQLAVAAYALDKQVPILGICLGMQSMTTAFAQRRLGPGIAMAEVDPHAPVKSFLPISDATTPAAHRVGPQRLRVTPGTRLATLLGAEASIRCNHRYRLNPAIIGQLVAAGLAIAAWDETGGIVDAVELPDHPFYMGIQGHPEITSRPDAPHPLIMAFLEAATAPGP